MRKMLARGLVAALFLASAASLAQTGDALTELNAAARGAYSDGRAALIARTSPVIVAAFDDLILVRDGKQTRERFTPDAYHQLKTVAHVPLGAVTLLSAQAPGSRDGAWRARLAELRDKARIAGAAVGATGLTASQKQRQQRILAESLRFIDAALHSGVPDEAALREHARGLGPMLLANARDAARAQIDGLHALTQRWRGELGPNEWRRLLVVVLGAKLPREGNLQYEYFVAALGPGSGARRVIYAEGIFNAKDGLALLATIVTDRRVGAVFFDDDTRMERDLLADAAKEHLLRIFGKLGSN